MRLRRLSTVTKSHTSKPFVYFVFNDDTSMTRPVRWVVGYDYYCNVQQQHWVAKLVHDFVIQ